VVRIVGDKGSTEIGKDRSRYYFGLKSNLFRVSLVPGGGLEWVSYRDSVRIMDMEVLGSKVVGTTYDRLLNSDRELVSLRTSGYVYELPDRFVFDGKGFGHSVGMSQWGAQGMALRGSDYEQILKHYYKGIELTSIGGA
jgi:stage II sporulation protein D